MSSIDMSCLAYFTFSSYWKGKGEYQMFKNPLDKKSDLLITAKGFAAHSKPYAAITKETKHKKTETQ
jgi:hypothetical protein